MLERSESKRGRMTVTLERKPTIIRRSRIGNIIDVFIGMLQVPLTQGDSDGYQLMGVCTVASLPVWWMDLTLLMQDVGTGCWR